MGYKSLELTLISAKDLKNVNLIGKMDVYVAVNLSDEPKSKQKTHVHTDGGTSPSWNFTMRFAIDEAAADNPGKKLVLQLKHEQTFGADKELGEVIVPLKELFDGVKGKDPSAAQFLTYQVMRSGKPKGELRVSYKLVDMEQKMGSYDASGYDKSGQPCSSSAPGPYPHPGMAQPYPAPDAGYPPPHQGYPPQQAAAAGVPYGAPQGYPPYGGYPPQGAGYGYPPSGGYPPQGGYPPASGYPPNAGGYPQYPPAGYVQQTQKPQKPKKSGGGGFGMGLGAGLLGGAIGGMVLGEAMDDGFDGGFDF